MFRSKLAAISKLNSIGGAILRAAAQISTKHKYHDWESVMANSSLRVAAFIMICGLCMQLPASVFAQTLGANFVNAANVWQSVPVNLATQTDTVAANIRSLRNSYWEPILAQNEGLTVTGSADPTVQPEIVMSQDGGWIEATFSAFHVYATDVNLHHIYTELNLTVLNVIRQPAGATLALNQTIDVSVPGGRAQSGTKVGSYNLIPLQYYWRPGHTYLVHVSLAASGSFYIPGERWDVTSGIVQEDEPVEVLRAANGNAVMAGKTTSNAISYLNQVLP